MTKVWSSNFQDTHFDVYQIRMLKDNFAYLIASGGQAIAIDVSEGSLLMEELQINDLTLDALLITHHHTDHISGAMYLKEKTNCQIIGPSHETLKFLDQDVADGEECSIGPFSFEVIETPGHTLDHVVYHFKECLALFCGDIIFLSGCGRIFDSTPKQLFESLEKLKGLPKKTLLLCGHDYLDRNLAFAISKDPENQELAKAEYVTIRTLEEEIPLNPFLRINSVEEFKALRVEKNVFDASWKD